MQAGQIDIEHVAKLARLELSDDEKSRFGQQLDDILKHVERLQEVATDGIEPTAHAHPLVNVLRPDEVRPGLAQEEALANAPESRLGQFAVPRVVGEG